MPENVRYFTSARSCSHASFCSTWKCASACTQSNRQCGEITPNFVLTLLIKDHWRDTCTAEMNNSRPPGEIDFCMRRGVFVLSHTLLSYANEPWKIPFNFTWALVSSPLFVRRPSPPDKLAHARPAAIWLWWVGVRGGGWKIDRWLGAVISLGPVASQEKRRQTPRPST